MARRFRPPWTAKHNESAFWVEDADGKQFGFCYFRANREGVEHSPAILTKDEARRLAANIAKLPDLLGS